MPSYELDRCAEQILKFHRSFAGWKTPWKKSRQEAVNFLGRDRQHAVNVWEPQNYRPSSLSCYLCLHLDARQTNRPKLRALRPHTAAARPPLTRRPNSHWHQPQIGLTPSLTSIPTRPAGQSVRQQKIHNWNRSLRWNQSVSKQGVEELKQWHACASRFPG